MLAVVGIQPRPLERTPLSSRCGAPPWRSSSSLCASARALRSYMGRRGWAACCGPAAPMATSGEVGSSGCRIRPPATRRRPSPALSSAATQTESCWRSSRRPRATLLQPLRCVQRWRRRFSSSSRTSRLRLQLVEPTCRAHLPWLAPARRSSSTAPQQCRRRRQQSPPPRIPSSPRRRVPSCRARHLSSSRRQQPPPLRSPPGRVHRLSRRLLQLRTPSSRLHRLSRQRLCPLPLRIPSCRLHSTSR